MSTRSRAAVILTVLGVVALAVALFRVASDGHQMSVVDEHIHLDTQFRVHDGSYPARGDLIGPEVVHEWACGVGHEGGVTTVPCGDPTLGPESLPSGAHTSGYIHYPTYFLTGEAWRRVADAVLGAGDPIDRYRQHSAAWMLLGLALCAVFSLRMGFRGSALVAGTFAPVAASGVLVFGTMVNPSATALAAGAAIGFTGLRWVRSGSGFGWLLVTTAAAALVAVTDSLPAGVFVLAVLVALVLRRRGHSVVGPWRPRWTHAAALLAVLVIPVVVYHVVIETRATMTNAELYSFAAVQGWPSVVGGTLHELTSLHTPWVNVERLGATSGVGLVRVVGAVAPGLPDIVTVLVFGLLLLHAGGGVLRSRDGAASEPGGGGVDPDRLLTGCALAGIMLYPPLLRLSNAALADVDFGVVGRYSISFAPLLIWLFLSVQPQRWPGRVLAVVSVGSAVALSMSAL